jgi:hypothetical protein
MLICYPEIQDYDGTIDNRRPIMSLPGRHFVPPRFTTLPHVKLLQRSDVRRPPQPGARLCQMFLCSEASRCAENRDSAALPTPSVLRAPPTPRLQFPPHLSMESSPRPGKNSDPLSISPDLNERVELFHVDRPRSFPNEDQRSYSLCVVPCGTHWPTEGKLRPLRTTPDAGGLCNHTVERPNLTSKPNRHKQGCMEAQTLNE